MTTIEDASYRPLVLGETIRLAKQERKVLDLLRGGQLVSNSELARISLKYFTKISNLRGKGYEIELVAEDRETGEAWYRLQNPLPRLRTFRVLVEIRIPGDDPVRRHLDIPAISATSAKYRAWRAVKVMRVGDPLEVHPTLAPQLY